jgi:hypothetical protein
MFSITRFAAAAVATATIVLGASLPAAAADLSSTIRNATQLGGDCLVGTAREYQIMNNLNLYQYYQFYHLTMFANDTKLHGFGTKIARGGGYAYYTWVIEMCHGEFIAEDELKNGKPGFAPE